MWKERNVDGFARRERDFFVRLPHSQWYRRSEGEMSAEEVEC